jgi:triosephosphate isomerase
MRTPIFAANWKMHLGPRGAAEFLDVFLDAVGTLEGREAWIFPSAVSLVVVSELTRGRAGIYVGAQHVHWEPAGAFTGELSIPMAAEAGAAGALVGHSERRHVFGETDDETGRKVAALLERDLRPMLCVGETIEEREADQTLAVVERQLSVLAGLDPVALAKVVIAYEPVWAIGTGRTATPADAASVHAAIRRWFRARGVGSDDVRVLYGGSVKPDNIRELMAEPDIDGVLVGGASLKAAQWAEMVRVPLD